MPNLDTSRPTRPIEPYPVEVARASLIGQAGARRTGQFQGVWVSGNSKASFKRLSNSTGLQ